MKIKLSIIGIALLLFFPVAKAQVTIGSKEPPRTGSLLDLNENANKGEQANANKGLGLPRVELEFLNKLTIDNESEKENYVGTMVYNITDNSNIKEGIYYWDGATWKQAIVVNSKGADGSILKSNGDGTYSWSQITIPDYKYYKPTIIRELKEGKAKEFTYPSNKLFASSTSQWVYSPASDTFTNHFVYTDTINVSTDKLIDKYMLLGTTILTKKATSNNAPPAKTSWEALRIEIIFSKINSNGSLGTSRTLKSYKKVLNTPQGGNAYGYLNLFSIISFSNSSEPKTELEKGRYQMKIRVSNLQHTFWYNMTEGGNYLQNSTFYKIGLVDVNFVFYEYE